LGMVVDALAAAMNLLGLVCDGAVVAREVSGRIGDPSSQGYLAHGGESPGVRDFLRVPLPLWATTPPSGQGRPGSIMPSVKLNPPEIGLFGTMPTKPIAWGANRWWTVTYGKQGQN